MEALTPAERRGALVIVLLLALGAGHDLWRASRPLPAPPPADGPATAAPAADDAGGREPPAPADAGPPPVDLNHATARELESLPGVGPVLAGRIVEHRRRHGPFRRPEELRAVRGIGPRLFERLRARITVAPREAPGAPVRAPAGATGD